MLDSFVNYLTYEKRYSHNTVISYRNDISQLFDYVYTTYGIKNHKEVTHYMIRSYLVSLIQNNISAKSVNRKFSSMRSYFLYLTKMGYIEKNPTKKIIPPKVGKRLPSVIQKKDITRLLDEIVFSEDFSGYRDKTIINILYNTGMRRAELINLKDADFDFISKTVKVLGKGNKERIIPMTEDLINSLKKYIEIRDKYFETDVFEYTLLTNKGNKLYPKFVYNVVKQNLAMVSTAEKKSPHVLRHSIATHLADEEVDLNAIKTVLGHASLSTTQIYTHTSVEKLKRVYAKAHPKS